MTSAQIRSRARDMAWFGASILLASLLLALVVFPVMDRFGWVARPEPITTTIEAWQ